MNHKTIIRRPSHSRMISILGVAALAIAVSVPLPLTSGGRATAASSSQFTTIGQTAGAVASSFDPASGIGVDVGVFQGGSASNRQTWLDYDVYYVDSFGNFSLLQGGYGLIPSDGLQVTGAAKPTTITLNTDTSAAANPGFTLFAGSGGVLSITWSASSIYWGTSSGSFQDHFGRDVTYQSSGTHYYSAATAQGRVIGTSVQGSVPGDAYAQVNSFQGIDVCRDCSP